LTTCISK